MTITIEQQQLLERIKADLEAKGGFKAVNGAFGDMEGCTGLLEDVIKPPEGGIYVKLYGCKQLMKGYPERDIVEGFSLAKSMVSVVPKEILAKNPLFLLAMGLTMLFNRKKFIHYLHVYFGTIYINEIDKLNIPNISYNRVSQELRRAMYQTIENLSPTNGELVLHRNWEAVRKEELREFLASFTEFLCLFMELDSAYRFRLQDALMLFDQEKAKKNVVKEIGRVFKIMEDRENPGSNMKDKARSVSRLIRFFLIFSPSLRRWVKAYLLELDLKRIDFDEADIYFTLQRSNWLVRGIPLEERIKEKQRIDQEQGNIMLKITQDEQGFKIAV
jgi:hypothetical protein